MASDLISPSSGRLRCGAGRRRAGITLVEVIVSAAMIGLTCSVVMFAFTQLNQMAMISRLYTGAATAAQSQIDLFSTDGPFQPQNNVFQTEQQPGTATTTIIVYQDPLSNFTVNGTMTTVVAAVNTSYTSGSSTDTLYLYRATVTVTYSYRNRNYSVAFSTVRTSEV